MWWKILLIIFAVIFLFLWQSVHIIIAYDGRFRIKAGLGLIRIDVLKLVDGLKNKPKKEKQEKKKKPKKEKEEPKKEKKPNVFSEVIQLRGVDGAVDLISEFASLLNKFGGGLVKHFIIRRLKLQMSICGKDAADTAIKFGAVNTALYPSLGIISSAAQVKQHEIQIVPDYLGQIDTQYVYIHMSYRILSLLAVLLGAVKDLLGIMKKESKINARIKARSKARAQARAKVVAENGEINA